MYSGREASAELLTTDGNSTAVDASQSGTLWCECTLYPQTGDIRFSWE